MQASPNAGSEEASITLNDQSSCELSLFSNDSSGSSTNSDEDFSTFSKSAMLQRWLDEPLHDEYFAGLGLWKSVPQSPDNESHDADDYLQISDEEKKV
jgi:hypothetical protein